MIESKKLVFIHLLNNFSGSPNVLASIIKGLLKKGVKVELVTNRGTGFLSDIEGVRYHYICYRWFDRKWETAFLLLFSQIQLFFRIFFSQKRNTIYYLNTITPVGAAWACWLTRKKFVYHVHENMQQDKPVYRLFRWTYKHCNQKSIFVSHYLKTTAVNSRGGIVVYNALNSDFVNKARKYLSQEEGKKENIIMVSSLRRYKGIYEFVELAKINLQFNFELILSAAIAEVAVFIKEVQIPVNLAVYPAQRNLHPFYRRAKLLLQLSHPSECIETFGMTILEAMVYGMPAIVPNVGGPAELVKDGGNGFLVNPHNLDDISMKIQELMLNPGKYESFTQNALKKSGEFSEEKMLNEIENYLISG